MVGRREGRGEGKLMGRRESLPVLVQERSGTATTNLSKEDSINRVRTETR
jgi:hypothetical protein